MLRPLLISIFSFTIVHSFAHASCLDDAAKFASQVCGEIAREGTSTSGSASASLDAKTNKVLSRVIGSASGSASGQIATQEYAGVVREQLAGDRFNTIECRQKMAEKAMKELCGGSTTQRPKDGGSLSQRLVGHWVRESNGEIILINGDGDIFTSQGQGRITQTAEAGANIAINYSSFSCFYQVTITATGSAIFGLKKGGKSCLPGTLIRTAE